MGAADRDVGRLVLRKHGRGAVDGDLGRAAHHDPMLGAMMMVLQGEAASWSDNNAFDLETVAAVHGLVPAPRPVIAQMLPALAMPAGLQLLDQLLDASRSPAIGN